MSAGSLAVWLSFALARFYDKSSGTSHFHALLRCSILLHVRRFWILVFRSTLRQSRPSKADLKCASARPSTKSFFDFNENWKVGRGWWVTHHGMQYDRIQCQAQVHEPSTLEILPFSNAISSAIYNGSWQLTTNS